MEKTKWVAPRYSVVSQSSIHPENRVQELKPQSVLPPVIIELTMKRNRIRLYIGGVLVIGCFIFIVLDLTGEHPDYKRAAKGLEEARSRAEKSIGPLSWSEHRKEAGTEHSSDLAA